tara:strand:+ start:425 stop:640 length:216 start_codon:yes stop_codon:yes gene_type:complete
MNTLNIERIQNLQTYFYYKYNNLLEKKHMTKKEKAELLIKDLERLRSDDPWDIDDDNIEAMIYIVKELAND